MWLFQQDKMYYLLKRSGIRTANLMGAAFLSVAAAGCEAVSIWTLLPMVRGVLNMDFSFIMAAPLFKSVVIDNFPHFIFSNKIIFVLLLTVIFISIASKLVFEYSATLIVAKEIRRSSNNLMKLIFARYLSFGKMFFDNMNIGYLNNILLNFTFTITAQLRSLQSILTNIFLMSIYLFFMFKISWKLALLALTIFPVLNFAVKWLLKKLEETSNHWASAYGIISSNISNILSCIPLVKLYCAENMEKRRFNSMSDRIEKILFSIDKKENFMVPLQEIIVLMAVLFLVIIMAIMVLKQKMIELSSFLVFFYILRRAQRSFGVFNGLKVAFAIGSGPTREILSILDDKDKFFIPQGDKEYPGLNKEIFFNNLIFSYRHGKQVLNGVTFAVRKGTTTAIVGPTGAGKTTIINLLLRFYDSPAGSILIDGDDTRQFSLKSLREHMSLVSQDVLLFNDTIRNNIIYGLKEAVRDEDLENVARKARLYDFIISLPDKFDTYIGDRGILLSGGEKQRMAIARAFLKGSEMLILDEATSSLDSKTEKLIQEAISEAMKGKTAVVIAHRLSTIKNADKIVVIEDGCLIEEGSLNELLDKKGKFYEYWQEQKFF